MRFYFSHDEGSEDDEEENEDELGEEEDEEEEDDEDYHEAEEEQESESTPVPNQQPNGFQFGIPKPEVVSGLSNLMAKFDFNFGSQSTTEVINRIIFLYSSNNLIRQKRINGQH